MPDSALSPQDFALISFLWGLGRAFIAVVAAWLILRQLDRMAGVSFKQVMGKLHENPIALSIYFATRFAGTLYFLGRILS